jgi:hypothetical protein
MTYFKHKHLWLVVIAYVIRYHGKTQVSLAGYEGWKQLKDAGKRWIAEIVFSSTKRVFGRFVVKEIQDAESRSWIESHAL